MVTDPANLLQRISELEPLCADPAIRRAVGTGDPFKVYRALVFAWLLRRLPRHRATLRLLIDNRRAFAKPLKGKLFLGTMNGFGATLLGSAEPEPDGTHVATHYVVAIFAVPLFPLGAYVVAGGERQGLSTSWRVFARVPLGAATWLWSRGLAVALAGAVFWAGAGVFHASRHHDVHVVNGFSKPVRVAIGPAKATVPAGQHLALNVPVGTHEARAVSEDGTEVEATRLEVSAGREFLAWNVAGAAPLLRTHVEYARAPSNDEKPPFQAVHCGEPIVRIPSVDDVFTEPPQSVSMSSGQNLVTRIVVQLAKGAGPDPSRACLLYLLDAGRGPDAVKIMEARGRLAKWRGGDASEAITMATAVAPEQGERLARLALAARADDVLVARSIQNALDTAGKHAEALEAARRRAEAQPDSAKAQYLLLRMVESAEQPALANALVARFPEDPDLLRIATALRDEADDPAGVDAAWRSLLAVAPDEAGHLLEEEAHALCALGRESEALRLLEDAFPRLNERAQWDAAVLYALVTRRSGATGPDRLLTKVERGGPNPVLRARAGLGGDTKGEPPVATLLRVSAVDPAAALRVAAKLSLLDYSALDAATWGLVYGEAVRRGDAAATAALGRLTPLMRDELEAFRRFVRGEPGGPPPMSSELRASALLIRSRNASVPAGERKELVARAKRTALLSRSVATAINAWPLPDADR